MPEEFAVHDVLAPPRATGGGYVSRARRRRMARSAAVALPAVAVIVFLSWPMLFTSAGMGNDWSTHLWEMWRQSLTIARDHEPSLFLNFSESVFYPLYAFYGGTLYALTAALSVLLGEAPVAAYVLTYIVGFAAAYGGWFWLGRMAGLGRWLAQAPALLFITAGYYVGLIYPSGHWTEFMAVSSIPLVVASVLSILRAKRLKILPALALAASTLVLFGSHNITLLWGVTLLALLGVALTAAVPSARASITRAGVMRVAVVAVPAALVNAWFLLPDVAYTGRTSIANVYDYARELRASSYLVSASNLFTPFHTIEAGEVPDFVYALPVVTIAFVLAGLVGSLRFRGDVAWRRILWIVSGLALLVAILMTHPGLILDLPHPYTLLQFGFRLESWVLLALSAAVLAILVLARSWPRAWRLGSRVMVIIALVAAGAGAVQQVDGYPGTGYPPTQVVVDRYTVFAPGGVPPRTKAGLGCEPRIGCGFDDNSLQGLNLASFVPHIEFPANAVRGDRLTLNVGRPVGTVIDTNLSGAPYFVNVAGAKAIGRDSRDHIVLEVTPAKGHPAGWISLSRADTLPIVLGRTITLLALAFLAVMFVLLLARRLRAQHSPTEPART